MDLVEVDPSEWFGAAHDVEHFGDFGSCRRELQTGQARAMAVGLGLAVGSDHDGGRCRTRACFEIRGREVMIFAVRGGVLPAELDGAEVGIFHATQPVDSDDQAFGRDVETVRLGWVVDLKGGQLVGIVFAHHPDVSRRQQLHEVFEVELVAFEPCLDCHWAAERSVMVVTIDRPGLYSSAVH